MEILVQFETNLEGGFAIGLYLEGTRWHSYLLDLKSFIYKHIFNVIEPVVSKLDIDIAGVADLKESISLEHSKSFIIVLAGEIQRHYFMSMGHAIFKSKFFMTVQSAVKIRKVVFDKSAVVDIVVQLEKYISNLQSSFLQLQLNIVWIELWEIVGDHHVEREEIWLKTTQHEALLVFGIDRDHTSIEVALFLPVVVKGWGAEVFEGDHLAETEDWVDLHWAVFGQV